ncbi:glycoside hydrolase family 2 TIM barrel-domain containing protein [Anaerorhabdus furcosa]|uniref:Beta-galactosidase n=1 Tax=Anaerorhabdus furcosa TaxID=118967 RepID=A0A1T4KHH3_9FIRM|nr:glycoside hydrolase family 2 TIM barrel-domain containing protein [Anaerorhabdus furcosa]SJZ41797.1 beta-galactosidase [Anaerorhabdus furcosa]
MRKIILCLGILIILSGCSKAPSQFVEPSGTPRPSIVPLEPDASFVSEEWYDNYEIFEINRELAHASFTPYSSIEEALEIEKSSLDQFDMFSSPYVQSLNGTWGFYYASKPSDRLKNIAGFDAFTYWEDWDDTLFEPIVVPSNIQTIRNEDGTFKYENPIYINQIYPWLNFEVIQYGFQGVPLAPTAVNSVGHYKREFELDESLKGRNVFLSFKGIESAFYVYVNGQRVGYSEDSYTTADFNITPYLKEGKNTLAVEVYRWSTGSYFENQDFIRLSGIFRDVLLYSKDDIEIRDYFVTTKLNDDYTEAFINVDASIRNLTSDSKSNYSLLIDIYDQTENKSVLDKPVIQEIETLQSYKSIKDEGININEGIQLKQPKLWSSEKPNLYRLVIQLIDEEGNPVETVCSRIGIREVEVKEINGKSQIVLNGKPIMLKGVNRHETSLMNGRVLTKDEIIQDLEIMKSYNINSFRTAHYPNQEITYDIADELGIYVVDEANIETHIGEKELGVPGNNPIYTPLILDRTMNMVERDKNHASILFWSLGNEATYKEYPMDENYPFYVTTMWVLNRDPSRLRVYERDNRIGKTREESMVDVVSSQYWTLDQINEYGKKEKNAFFQSEYGHGMGNALGNFEEYYDSYRQYENIQGGFIWDFIDQSIYTTDENGIAFYGNGSDWGTLLHDGDFCGNGLISANRVPQAEIEEVKKVQQDFQMSYKNNLLSIESECVDTNLNEFDVTVELLHDGKSIYNKKLSNEETDLKPLVTRVIKLMLPDLSSYTGEVLLNVFVTYRYDQKWANEYGGKKGDVNSKEQFILQEYKPTINFVESKMVKANEDDKEIVIHGEQFEIIFNKSKGIISSYSINGEELFSNGPRVSFYRSPVSNDIEFSEEVKNADTTYVPNKISFSVEDKYVVVISEGIIESTNTSLKTIYTVNGEGEVLIEPSIKIPTVKSVGEIARVGLVLDLSNGMTQYTLYGRGPFENYVDRNSASFIGIYTGNVDEWFNDTYLTPQDSGNKTDIRWIEVSSDNSKLRFASNQEFGVNILPYSDQDISNVKHYYELEGKEKTTMHLDVMQRGLGNGSWGAEPLEQYKIKQGKTIKIKFLISPK